MAMGPSEVDIAVRSLQPFTIKAVGSAAWKDQRDSIERLNVTSHKNAQQKKDDTVVSYLVQHEMLPVLLHELLAAEVWRQRIMPHVVNELLETPTGVYMYCSYESQLVNLFECMMFQEEVVVNLGDDLLELIDYCWRNVSCLFANSARSNDIPEEVTVSEEDSVNGPKRFWSQMETQQTTNIMSCVSILWFIVDRLKSLPLSAMNSILVKNDLAVGMSELIAMQPWNRRDKSKNRYQKYKGQKFEEIKAEDQLLVCSTEAHAWFILHYLMCDRDARTKYQYTKSRKEIIMGVKKFLHETMIDQLPALMDVQRAVEELSFLEPPTGTEEKFKSTLLIDQVPRLMASLEAAGGKNGQLWGSIVEDTKRMLRSQEGRMEDAMRYSALFDQLYSE